MDIKELNLTDEQMALVQKYVQSETDKVRTDYSQKLKTANDELAQYKPKEKSDAEKALEERITALENREKELASKEKAMTIANKLKDKGIPIELAQYLNVGDNVDETVEKVGALFGNYFLDGTSKPTNHNTHKGITREDFNRMRYAERAKPSSEGPEVTQAVNTKLSH